VPAQVLVKIPMVRSTICNMLFAANIAIEQEVVVGEIMKALFHVCTL